MYDCWYKTQTLMGEVTGGKVFQSTPSVWRETAKIYNGCDRTNYRMYNFSKTVLLFKAQKQKKWLRIIFLM